MSYEPHTWVDDETITAAKLNAMEQGIAQGGGGEYDAEIYVYHSNNSSASYEVTILNGSFSSLMEKINDAVPPTLLVRCWDDYAGHHFTSSFVAIYYFSSSAITFRVKYPTVGVTLNSQHVLNSNVVWFSDDEISFDFNT